MNGFILRIIAMMTMLIDHIGWIAFQVYAFLLAEGFLIICHDSRRLKKHLAIMLILTVVSFPGYALLESGLNYSEYRNSQSNMVTLLIGYAGMLVTEALIPSSSPAGQSVPKINIYAAGCAYFLCGFANYLMNGNFNFTGPLLVIAFYWYIRMSKADAKLGNPWSWGRRIVTLSNRQEDTIHSHAWVGMNCAL